MPTTYEIGWLVPALVDQAESPESSSRPSTPPAPSSRNAHVMADTNPQVSSRTSTTTVIVDTMLEEKRLREEKKRERLERWASWSKV